MEGDEKDIMHVECPRKLNLNAPLLSTRHPIGLKRLKMPRGNSLGVSLDLCERIPFSWEQTPGKPKKIEAIDVQNVDFYSPPPKLPPSRWIPTKENSTDVRIKEHYYDYDDGFDGNVEDHCKNDDVDHSDAIDIFSLGQSGDMVEPGDDIEMFGFKGLETEKYRGSHSPNFIIQRFLPDAKALAASSVLKLSSTIEDPPEQSSGARAGLSRTISVRQSYPMTKGCGLDIFFPWRMKPKPCGTNNPVVAASTLREKHQVQCSRRNK